MGEYPNASRRGMKKSILVQGGTSPALASYQIRASGTGRDLHVVHTQRYRKSFHPMCAGPPPMKAPPPDSNYHVRPAFALRPLPTLSPRQVETVRRLSTPRQ